MNSGEAIEKARLAYEDHNLTSAVELLEPLLDFPPIGHQALLLLFKIYREGRWWERAELTYRRLLNATVASIPLYALHLEMARVYHAGGRISQSLAAVDMAIALKLEDRAAYDLLVQVHESQGSLQEAVKILQRSVALQRDNAVLFSILAKTYEKLEWWTEAQKTAQQAIDLKPTMTEPQHILRRVEKQIQAAPQCFLDAAKRCEDAGDIESMLEYWLDWAKTTRQADDFATVGEWCEQRGEWKRAEYAFNQSLGLSLDHARARKGIERVKRKKTLKVEDSRNNDQLRELYEWFIKYDDAPGAVVFLEQYCAWQTYAPALGWLARAYRATGQLDRAINAFEEAIEKSANFAKPELCCELGDIYQEQDDKQQAGQYFQKALHYQRNYLRAKQKLAALRAQEPPRLAQLHEYWEKCRAMGDYQEALEYFAGLLKDYPQEPHLHVLMAYAYEKLERIEEAYLEHQQAASLAPTFEAFMKLGDFCRDNDLLDEAAEAYKQAQHLNPRNLQARFSLSHLPRPLEQRLQARVDKPDSQYLWDVWKWTRRENPAGEAVKYFTALADVLPDEPTLFRLLGDAYDKCGDRAAIEAYQYWAALTGRAQDYVRLAEVCRRYQSVEMAEEAYQVALELNPFCYDAREYLANKLPDRFSPGRITGHPYREDLARDLCETPDTREGVNELGALFIKSGTVEYAEATFQLLHKIHPRHSFAKALAQVYQECGLPQPLPTESLPPMEEVAPTIATEWYAYRPTTLSAEPPAELLRQAHRSPVGDVTQLGKFLKAAFLYERAGQSKDVLSCLVGYGQAMAHYRRKQGNTTEAQKMSQEALRLAVSHCDAAERQDALVEYVLNHLHELENMFGPPSRWPTTVHSEFDALLEVGRSLASPRLGNWLGLVQSYLLTIQQIAMSRGFSSPFYREAVLRRRASAVLLQHQQERWLATLERWEVNRIQPAIPLTNRARLKASLPPLLDLPHGARELDLPVTLANDGNVPADGVWVTLAVEAGFGVEKPRQFLPFVPSGIQTVMFHLASIPDQPGHIEVQLNLRYFDPVDRQEATLRAAPTLRRPERPFKDLDNRYETAWPRGQQVIPEYLGREQVERLLRERVAGIDWTRTQEQIWKLTGGEAVTLEMLAHRVVERLNHAGRIPAVVLPLDVEAAAQEMLDDRQHCPHFMVLVEGRLPSDMDNRLSNVDKLILACLAARADDPGKWVRQDDLLQDLKNQDSRISHEDLQSRLRQGTNLTAFLQSEGTLDSSYQYRIKIELLHDWLRKYWTPVHALAQLWQLSADQLRDIFATQFDENELRDVCFEMKVDYDSLSTAGKFSKARELVLYFERRGRTDELIRIIRQHRPHAVWQNFSRPEPL